jgi:hypothetical protein
MAFPAVNPNFLMEASVTAATLRKYKSALSLFLSFFFNTLHRPPQQRNLDHVSRLSPVLVDRILAQYCEFLYTKYQGSKKYLAINARAAVAFFFPHMSPFLRLSARSIKGWEKLHPTVSHPPLSYDLVCLLSTRMAALGHIRHAAALLLSFDCYLRLGEVAKIQVHHLVLPGDLRLRGLTSPALLIPLSKTGRDQFITIRNPVVIKLLQALKQKFFPALSSTDFVFPYAYSLSSVLKSTLHDLGLSDRCYVWHSLRHGGATDDALKGMPIEEIVARGRWSSSKMLKTYVQRSRAFFLHSRTPARLSKAGLKLASSHILLFKTIIRLYHRYRNPLACP